MTTSHPRWFIFAPILALLFVGVAAVAFSLGTSSGGSTARMGQPTTIPGHPELGPGWTAPSTVGAVPGSVAVTISKIEGSMLSLQTTDGWTRTIDASGATITKSGQKIALSDLKIGDRIAFREARQSDGTYKIAAIQVAAPATGAGSRASVLGTVASKTATSIVVTTTGGKTITVNVSSATRFLVRGVARPTLADIAVGNRITAQGTLNSDGSVTATVIQAVLNVQPGGRGGRTVPLPSARASAPNV